jgi:hypothetical protein
MNPKANYGKCKACHILLPLEESKRVRLPGGLFCLLCVAKGRHLKKVCRMCKRRKASYGHYLCHECDWQARRMKLFNHMVTNTMINKYRTRLQKGKSSDEVSDGWEN